MTDVFVSYSAGDRAVAEVLVRRIEAEGWEVFWDQRIPPGADWESELERQLERAVCVVLLWSRNAAGSDWVRTEVRAALDRGQLLPLCLDDTAVPLRVSQIQCVRLERAEVASEGDRLGPLLQALARRLEDHGRARARPRQETRPPEDFDFGMLGMD